MSMHQPTSTSRTIRRGKRAAARRGRGCLNKAALLGLALALTVGWLLTR